jgi:hypothetical protein
MKVLFATNADDALLNLSINSINIVQNFWQLYKIKRSMRFWPSGKFLPRNRNGLKILDSSNPQNNAKMYRNTVNTSKYKWNE